MHTLTNFLSAHADSRWLWIGLVFLLAGAIKGVVGLGLPTIAIGLLGMAMPPLQAAAILIVPSFFTNVWQACAGGNPWPMLKRLRGLWLGIVLGTLAGGLAGRHVDSRWAGAALGLALVVYAVLGLAAISWSVAPAAERRLAPLIGASTGIVTAITGVFVVPAVPFLQALGLERNQLVQAMGLAFTVSTIALAGALALDHGFAGSALADSLLALPAALLGMMLGQWVRGRLHPLWFRRCFFSGLLLVGAHALIRPWL